MCPRSIWGFFKKHVLGGRFFVYSDQNVGAVNVLQVSLKAVLELDTETPGFVKSLQVTNEGANKLSIKEKVV